MNIIQDENVYTSIDLNDHVAELAEFEATNNLVSITVTGQDYDRHEETYELLCEGIDANGKKHDLWVAFSRAKGLNGEYEVWVSNIYFEPADCVCDLDEDRLCQCGAIAEGE